MRILTVEPGPAFSVADVHRGWFKAFQRTGNTVRNFNLADRINFCENAIRGKVPEVEKGHMAARMVAEQLRATCFDFWPDLVVIFSAFLVPPETFDVIRSRGIRIAVVLTESPYEDPSQIPIAARSDLAFINDPTNLERFRETQPNTWYCPQAYDPEIHYRRPMNDTLRSDFAWVGTAFPSRIAFFEQVEWEGIDVALAGNWQELAPHSPLQKYLVHDQADCFPNDSAADLYSSTNASVNLYRKEAAVGFNAGWAMGPREIELAATGTFFLREPRPESDMVLSMLPTFDSVEEFGEKLRWWLAHPTQREQAAIDARTAVADRTFDNNVRQMLDCVSALPTFPGKPVVPQTPNPQGE